MANLILSIGFTEAVAKNGLTNAQNAIKQLCAYAGLPESEANAKLALKQLAVATVKQGLVSEARQKAESELAPE